MQQHRQEQQKQEEHQDDGDAAPMASLKDHQHSTSDTAGIPRLVPQSAVYAREAVYGRIVGTGVGSQGVTKLSELLRGCVTSPAVQQTSRWDAPGERPKTLPMAIGRRLPDRLGGGYARC